MFRMTFEEYDKYLEIFKDMKEPTYYPSPLMMDYFDPKDITWVLFACYLYECGRKVRDKSESYSRKTLRDFITDNLELYENEITL